MGLSRNEDRLEDRQDCHIPTTVPERARQASRVGMEVTVGDASEAILQKGRRLKAGPIVMRTHGLGGLRRLLFRSKTEQVLRRTDWPVRASASEVATPPTSSSSIARAGWRAAAPRSRRD